MALATVAIVLAKEKAFNFINAVQPKEPFAQMSLSALFQYLGQHGGNPDLQTVTFQFSNSADTVVMDAACKMYAFIYKKPAASTTAAFINISDHGSAVQAEEEFRLELGASENYTQVLLFPRGKPYGTGVVAISATTAAGGTRSATADCGHGLAILGAA